MRRWKVALSLAILGAITAPFITGTFEKYFWYEVRVPLTPADEKRFARVIEKTNNCQSPERMDAADDPYSGFAPPDFAPVYSDLTCRNYLKSLNEGLKTVTYPSTSKYLAINSAAALAGFGIVFGAAIVIPVLFRAGRKVGQRYWHWLNT